MKEKTANTTLLTGDVRQLANGWLNNHFSGRQREHILLGLPEWDGRKRLWRVALVSSQDTSSPIGELQVSNDGEICKYPSPKIVNQRLTVTNEHKGEPLRQRDSTISFPATPNKVILGDCREVLRDFPPESAQLVFTSPPYFNAKFEYAEYVNYESYLNFLGEAFSACHDVLAEGRFLVVNLSPVLVRRTSRSTSSKRLPIPFDLHPILNNIGFEFIDDIIWRKPEGAGWHLGRGRRFAADRQPLQYKPVTVTEYVMVYRKKTDRLIDWNLRNHPDSLAVEESLILGSYERTNIWEITPASHKAHPAVFPDELVNRVVRYYSFQGDSVLDPFAGIGTVGRVASSLERKFILIEKRPDYFEEIRYQLIDLFASSPIDFDDVQYLGSADIDSGHL